MTEHTPTVTDHTSGPNPSTSAEGDDMANEQGSQAALEERVSAFKNSFDEDTPIASQVVPHWRNRLDLPWSDLQEWALREKISRHMVQVSTNDDNLKCLILWRNLVDDTPQLVGYPVLFLVERLKEMRQNDKAQYPVNVDWQTLPYLDAFEFENEGGLTGNVYGVQGVADGTRIRTTPVGDVHVTIPRNFVRTADGSVIYELGRPIEQTRDQSYPLSRTTTNTYTKHWQRDGKELAASMMTSNGSTETRQQRPASTIVDNDLLQLGGLTALVMGGALAMESLSHHLTINVFWV